MGTNEAESGKSGALVPIQQGQIQRLPDESEQAFAAMRAYCELDPGQRTIAAAYRALKGVGPAAKVPGYFGKWASKYRWKERSAIWDSYFGGLVVSRNAEKLEAARNETIEQAEELQDLIKQEIKQLQQQGGLGRLLPGHTRNRTADLANLAAALKDAAAARMMALGGIEPDYE